MEAPPTPWVLPSPDRQSLLVFSWDVLTPIAELAEPELRLAGQRIQPRFFGQSRTRPYTGMATLSLADRSLRPVTGLPPSPWLINARYSPSGKKAALTHRAEKGWELWVVDLEKAEARRLTQPILSPDPEGAAGMGRRDSSGGAGGTRRPRPAARGADRARPDRRCRRTSASPRRRPTYQDLLKNRNDENLFRYYMSSQLVRVDSDGKLEKLGEPALYSRLDPSPDGNYLLVETLHEPFSYLVPADNFPTRIEIRDARGQGVRQIVDRPLQESIPIANGSVATGPRRAEWRSDTPATLVWAEAQDGGDSGKDAPLRDKLFALAAPFRGEPVTLAALPCATPTCAGRPASWPWSPRRSGRTARPAPGGSRRTIRRRPLAS